MKIFVSLFCSILIIASCTKENTTPDNNSPGQAQNFPDISYGADAKQKIDIYLPADRTETTTKTMVIIHGGGWTEGDKNEMTFVVDSLKKRFPGYAFINVNYRLASNNTVNLFPTQENDVKAAISFYLNRSAEFHVSKDLILLGASAGGHLALLYSYKDDAEKHVKAVVDFFGPVDLPALWSVSLVQQLILVSATGKLYDQDPALYIQSSPVTFINGQTPPTIAIQGGTDLLVPPAQSNTLIARLQDNGIANQLVYYPTGGHGDWPLSTYSDSFEKIQQFIASHVH